MVVEVEANTISGAELVGCPKCAARLSFQRSASPVIDACGFESYSLECADCGSRLIGIIDPSDDSLLLAVE